MQTQPIKLVRVTEQELIFAMRALRTVGPDGLVPQEREIVQAFTRGTLIVLDNVNLGAVA